jgi:succinylarginine dihydrolase
MATAAAMREVNFDGLVGPTHNYAGLSLGNLAAAQNAGSTSMPRSAALQGIEKMRLLISLGLSQGMFPPHDRPQADWLRRLGFVGSDEQVCAAAWREDPALLTNAISASAMWAANAATVSPAPDSYDGRCHLSVANLATMLHRSIEPAETERQLHLAFADTRYFAVHGPLPHRLGDEGAANFMRLCLRHGAPGVELLAYGQQRGGGFPARQSRAASAAIARRHGLDPSRCLLVEQSEAAIAAGAFHNDVVAVANETVLLAHEDAFAERDAVHRFIAETVPEAIVIEARRDQVSLDDAIASYLFNSQLVTLPDQSMLLIVPGESRESTPVWAWLQEVVAGNNPIRAIRVVDLRESMRNGGGPACLRLRVVVDDAGYAAIDPRFLLDEAKLDRIAALVELHWPAAVAPLDLGEADFWRQCREARRALLDLLDLGELA